MSDWRDIRTAPKKDEKVILVYRPNSRTVGIDYWSKDLGAVWAKSPRGDQPTHWRPLPAPPPEAA